MNQLPHQSATTHETPVDYRYLLPGIGLAVLALLKPNRLTLALAAAASLLGVYGSTLDRRYQWRGAVTEFSGVDAVMEASEESFPASDPPSWTAGPTAGR